MANQPPDDYCLVHFKPGCRAERQFLKWIDEQHHLILVDHGATLTYSDFQDAVEHIGAFLPARLVTKTNLMSGEEFQEPENTPYYLSPSSETYWST